jgi:dTDP-4-amino-4,6-dideoxygalactose transaminase
MTAIPLVDLKAQYRTIRQEIDAALSDVISRADFILGRSVDEFENAFAGFIGTKHCVGVASGTDALRIALKALEIGPGHQVLLPANTFIATALAVNEVGATPVLVDIDRESYTINVDSARRALSPDVKAIMPVHLYGQPADMRDVMELARNHGLFVIEDVAQAHGAVHRLGRCGALGTAAAFSFHPAKNLGAFGDGGAVCTDDESLAHRMRELRNMGSTVKYDHPVRGFNSRLDSIQAAVLSVKLAHLDRWNRNRRQIAEWYREELAVLTDRIELPNLASWTVEHVYHLFVVRIRGGDRDRVFRTLQEAGIGCGVHYPRPVHLLGAYADLGHGPGSFPCAEEASLQVLSLPLYPEMTFEQVQEVARHLSQALGR